MSVVDEVIAANKEYAKGFAQGRPRDAARTALRDPDLHGRTARPCEVRRPQRRRRPRDPQRRRARQRRRDPLARHLLQAARHGRVVRDPPHQLRHGVLHQRLHGDLLAQSLETAALGPDGFHDVGSGPGSARAPHRLADDQRPRPGVVDDVRRIRDHPLVPCASRSTATSTTSRPAPRGSGCSNRGGPPS